MKLKKFYEPVGEIEKNEYFIKWKNFNSKFNYWESEENLNDAAKDWLDNNHLIIENSYKK